MQKWDIHKFSTKVYQVRPSFPKWTSIIVSLIYKAIINLVLLVSIAVEANYANQLESTTSQDQ